MNRSHSVRPGRGAAIKCPLVSVVIPVFNGERFLADCLRSVFAQDYSPFEVIIVDDGSEDRTAQVAKDFPVRYIYQDNQGPSSARNTGIAAARGDYISFFDHDDLMMPNKLKLQAQCLTSDPDIGIVLSRESMVCDQGVELPPMLASSSRVPQPGGLQDCLPMVRKDILSLVGGFDPDFWVGEDLEWLSRALSAGVRIHTRPEALRLHRFHGSNLTYMHPGPRPVLLKILRKRAAEKRRIASEDGGR